MIYFCRRMKKYIFPVSIGFTALLLAAVAALFSITGMGKIFVGWPILIMTSAIELGKLVAVSVLYRLWSQLKWWRWILVPMTLIIMMLTSAGIYGYLSSAYEHTASGMRTGGSRIELEEKRKVSVESNIKFYQESIDRKQQRSLSLAGLRAQQENRMDSLYAKNQIRSAKSVQASIVQTDQEISKLNKESDSLNVLIENAHMKIAAMDSTIIVMNDEMGKGETGSLKYISRVTGMSMDNVANLFMLCIIAVFDPLAIIFVIVFNIAWDKAQKKEEEVVTKPLVDTVAASVEEPVTVSVPVEEQKVEDPVKYETDPSGEFVKVDEPVPPAEKEVKKAETKKAKSLSKHLFLALLRVLYQDGKLRQHDHIEAYDRFTGSVVHSGVNCTSEQIDEFLKKCVMWKIIKIGNTQRVALKSYEDAMLEVEGRIA